MERQARSTGGASSPGGGTRLAGRSPPDPQRGPQTDDVPLRDALRPCGPARLDISEDHQPGGVVLRVDGELDLLTAPRLGVRLNEISHQGSGDVVVDLRGVVFIDSAGLHMLLSARRRLERTARRLEVICDEGPVRRVIEVTRLLGALGVRSDPPDLGHT